MKIAWISSWPPRPCGIATYSLELVEAIKKEGVEVHIICHTDGGKPGEKNVYPVINLKETDWQDKLYLKVKQINPDILHIQHEYGLYSVDADWSAGLFRPLFRWRIEENFPIVVTFHSVYSELGKERETFLDIIQRVINAGIVHEYHQWLALHVNLGRIIDNFYIIPHGAKENISFSREDAKRALGLEGKKIIGMIGWFTPTKGFHRVINMWDSISKKTGSDTYLILAGEAREGEKVQKEYKRKLLSLVEKCKNKDKIKVIIKNFSPEEYEKVVASFDVAVLPYTFISQSGTLAHSFSLGVPVVASSLEGLKAEIEASGGGILVPPDDNEELRKAIVTLIKDNTLREKLSQKALRYVKEKIGWSIVAKKHIKLYEKLIREKKSLKDLKKEATL